MTNEETRKKFKSFMKQMKIKTQYAKAYGNIAKTKQPTNTTQETRQARTNQPQRKETSKINAEIKGVEI